MAYPEDSSELDEPVELVSEEERERSGVACFTTLASSLADWEQFETNSKAKR
jgi:hypothetical protein